MASCPLPRYATSCFHNLTWIPKTQWTHYYFQFVYGQYVFSGIRFGIHKFSVVSTQDHFPTEYTIWREIGVLIKPSGLLISHFSRFCFSWLTVQYFPTVTKLSFVATSRRLADISLWRETQLSLVKTASGHRKFPSAETLHQEQISQVTRHHFVM